MAIGVDKVQVIKQESTALGGDDGDKGPYDSPEPIDAQEDAIESAGGYVNDEVDRDELVGWYRKDGIFYQFDTNYPMPGIPIGTGESIIEAKGILTTWGGIVYTPGAGNEVDIVIKD